MSVAVMSFSRYRQITIYRFYRIAPYRFRNYAILPNDPNAPPPNPDVEAPDTLLLPMFQFYHFYRLIRKLAIFGPNLY